MAIVALALAIRSAKDASISAAAAEESLTIMRDEAKLRARRADPVVFLSAAAIPTAVQDGNGRTDVLLTLGFRNEGERAAEHLNINFLIPEPLSWIACDGWGANNREGSIHGTAEQLDGSNGARYWRYEIDRLDPRGAVSRVHRLRIYQPWPKTYLLKGVLMQEDLPQGLREHYWRLDVTEQGDVALEDVGGAI